MTLFDADPAEQPGLGIGIRRVVLRNVGPSEARFSPLDLDLTDGAGVPARRVLASLVNTGGKSTLVKLLTVVLHPAQARYVGKGTIADSVLSQDTAHVVIEWQGATGTRFVTGWVAEWPGRRRVPDRDGDLKNCWYVFRPDEGAGVDDLPFTRDGHRSSWTEYRQQLRELFAGRPQAGLVIADTQQAWLDVLPANTPLDPELIRYQATMNQDEGEAGNLLDRLKTTDGAVGFFADAFTDEEDLRSVFGAVGEYVRLAASRTYLEVEADLAEAAAVAVTATSTAGRERDTAVEMLDGEKAQLNELHSAFGARLDALKDSAETSATVLQAAKEQVASLATLDALHVDRRRQFRLLAARFEANAAAETYQLAVAELLAAESQFKAWRLVPALLGVVDAETTLATTIAAYDEAEGELAPLRRRAAAAAADLLAALLAEINVAEIAAASGRHALAAAVEAAKTETTAASHADANRAVALEQKKQADTAIAVAGAKYREAVAVGLMGADEAVEAAVARWTAARDDAARSVTKARASADTATAEAADDDLNATRARAQADALRTKVQTADHWLADESASRDRLCRHDVAVDLLRGDETDEALGQISSHLDDQAAVARTAATNAAVAQRLIDDQIEAMGGALVSGPPSQAAVVKALTDARIGAMTGWQWLHNVVAPGARPDTIAAAPDLANGVIVSDPTRYDDAVEALRRAHLRPTFAVVVAPNQAPPARSADRRYVVDPHPGLYDEDKAAEELERLHGASKNHREARDDADARVEASATAAAAVRRHVDDYPHAVISARQAERNSDAEEQATAQADAERHLTDATTKREQVATARAAEAAAEEEQATAASTLDRLRAVTDTHAVAADARRHLPVLEDSIRTLTRHAATHRSNAGGHETTAEAHRTRIGGLERDLGRLRDEAAGLPVEPTAPAAAGTARQLRGVHEAAAQVLHDAEAGRDHGERRSNAVTALERARTTWNDAVDRLPDTIIDQAHNLASTTDAATTRTVQDAQNRATDVWNSVTAAEAEARLVRDQTLAAVNEQTPTDRNVWAALSEDDTPVDAADSMCRAALEDAALVDVRADTAAAARSVDDATDEAARISDAVKDFGRLHSDSHDTHGPSTPPFADNSTVAAATLAKRNDAHQAAVGLVASATELLNKRVRELQLTLNQAQWRGVTGPLVDRTRELSPEAASVEGARLANDMRERALSIRADIRLLDDSRGVHVEAVGQLCDRIRSGLGKLRTQTVFRGAGDANLAGQPAVRIDFERRPPSEADAALAALVDRWTTLQWKPTNAFLKSRLLEALHETVVNRPRAGRWTVKLLKPRIDQQLTYCDPARVKVEYSGGQELTLAVLVYCALAAVRTASSGSGRPPGVLLMDNPFGKASAEQLTSMQYELADQAGVQVVCVSALDGPEILTGFSGPGTRRHSLYSDTDRRTGRHHVRVLDDLPADVAGIVRAHLDGPANAGEGKHVAGVGFTVHTPLRRPADLPTCPPGDTDPDSDDPEPP